MKTITTTVYTFDELSDDAKEKAREWWREGAFDYEWYEFTYDDAAKAGLEIQGFDLDRRNIDAKLVMSLKDSITMILKEHGSDCDTYKLAMEYKPKLTAINKRHRASDYEDTLEALTEEYTYALKEEYLSMLQKEVDYLLSDESVDESILANEYTFTAEGKREG